VENKVRENFHHSLKVLETFAKIEEVTLPDFPYEAVTRTILNAEAVSAFDEFIASGKLAELTAPEDRYSPYVRTIVLAKEYLRALRIRGLMAKAMDALLAQYDAIVAPTRPTEAPPIDKEFRSISAGTASDVIGAIGNTAGLPGLSVPNGFGEKGLPTGLLFMGRAFTENTLFAMARTYQEATSWHTQHPPGLV
jgi:aspartyl-tRNA(Asn)/glutamyl-tRNA(Gln) amidotransferase subunit A